MKIVVVGLLFLGIAAAPKCQLVQIGPPDPHYCEKLKVEPNLFVEQDANLSGRLVDTTGDPLRESPVELRIFISPKKQKSARKVMTDREGRFQIGSVKAGRYRLVASPTWDFRQPEHLKCTNKNCELDITLRLNPTDMPESRCPVR